RRARFRFVAAFHRPVIRIFSAEDYGVIAFLGERAKNLVTTSACEVTGKEAPIADENAKRHSAGRRRTSGLGCGPARGALCRGFAAGVGFEFVETHTRRVGESFRESKRLVYRPSLALVSHRLTGRYKKRTVKERSRRQPGNGRSLASRSSAFSVRGIHD